MGEIEMKHGRESSKGAEKRTVEIMLKTIGPLRPSCVNVPSRLKVRELRKLLAENKGISTKSLSLISRGKLLLEDKKGEDADIEFKDGDTLIVAVKPKAQVKQFRAGFDDDEDDEDDLKFQISESTNWWKQRLFMFLRDKLKLPDIILMAIFYPSIKAWAIIILWFVIAPIAHRWDFGPIYILGTGFAIIFLNLGRRQKGDVSAYSIFNEDFRELPGTLNADRLDRDIRAGQF